MTLIPEGINRERKGVSPSKNIRLLILTLIDLPSLRGFSVEFS